MYKILFFFLPSKDKNISEFLSLSSKKRDGSEKDVQSLKRIFEKFGFSIDTCIDQTEEGIKQAISQFKSCVLEGRETCDMIVVAIMSHGTGNSFFSADGHPIPMEYILEYVQDI